MNYLIDLDNLPEPPSQMKIRVSRRGLFRAAADLAEERKRSRDGLPSYHIEDVSTYDDRQLAEVKPIVNCKAKISLEKGTVFAATSAVVGPVPLFSVTSPVLFVFNRFNGDQSIAQICKETADHFGWDEEKTQRIVRTVFLKLCEVRVCEPGNAE